MENVIRTKSFEFALSIIRLYQSLQKQHEYVVSKQLLRCGTSIGANVEEATAAQSRKDFLSKMAIASKEARETKYWLLLLRESDLVHTDVATQLAQVEELIRILTSIVKTPANDRNSTLKLQNSQLHYRHRCLQSFFASLALLSQIFRSVFNGMSLHASFATL